MTTDIQRLTSAGFTEYTSDTWRCGNFFLRRLSEFRWHAAINSGSGMALGVDMDPATAMWSLSEQLERRATAATLETERVTLAKLRDRAIELADLLHGDAK